MQNFSCSKSYKEYIDFFLNEEKLGQYLKLIFPGYTFIRDKRFLTYLFRPDYVCHELKLAIEFDGEAHYTKAKVILNDYARKSIYEKEGYKIVRIPGFIQLNTEIIKFLFDVDYEFEQIFPHGFICKELTLPADFCELGIERFRNDLEYFSMCKKDIIESLNNKIKFLNSYQLVLPSSFNNIIPCIENLYSKREELLKPYLNDLRWIRDMREFSHLPASCLKNLVSFKFINEEELLFEGDTTDNRDISSLIAFLEKWEKYDINCFGYETNYEDNKQVNIQGIVFSSLSKNQQYINGQGLNTRFHDTTNKRLCGKLIFKENKQLEKEWNSFSNTIYSLDFKEYFIVFNS